MNDDDKSDYYLIYIEDIVFKFLKTHCKNSEENLKNKKQTEG